MLYENIKKYYYDLEMVLYIKMFAYSLLFMITFMSFAYIFDFNIMSVGSQNIFGNSYGILYAVGIYYFFLSTAIAILGRILIRCYNKKISTVVDYLLNAGFYSCIIIVTVICISPSLIGYTIGFTPMFLLGLLIATVACSPNMIRVHVCSFMNLLILPYMWCVLYGTRDIHHEIGKCRNIKDMTFNGVKTGGPTRYITLYKNNCIDQHIPIVNFDEENEFIPSSLVMYCDLCSELKHIITHYHTYPEEMFRTLKNIFRYSPLGIEYHDCINILYAILQHDNVENIDDYFSVRLEIADSEQRKFIEDNNIDLWKTNFEIPDEYKLEWKLKFI